MKERDAVEVSDTVLVADDGDGDRLLDADQDGLPVDDREGVVDGGCDGVAVKERDTLTDTQDVRD